MEEGRGGSLWENWSIVAKRWGKDATQAKPNSDHSNFFCHFFSGLIELFRLFKLFGWFSIHVALNSVCHFFPNATRFLGSQFPFQKKASTHYVHRHAVFSKLAMTEAIFPQGWVNIWVRERHFSVCSLLTRHLLRHFLFLDRGLLFADCFYQSESLKSWLTSKLFFLVSATFYAPSLNSCLITHKIFLMKNFSFKSGGKMSNSKTCGLFCIWNLSSST